MRQRNRRRSQTKVRDGNLKPFQPSLLQLSRINTIDDLGVDIDGGAAEGDDAIFRNEVRMIIDE